MDIVIPDYQRPGKQLLIHFETKFTDGGTIASLMVDVYCQSPEGPRICYWQVFDGDSADAIAEFLTTIGIPLH